MTDRDSKLLTKIDDQLAEYEGKLSDERANYIDKVREIDEKLKRVRAKRRAGREPVDGKAQKPAPKQDEAIAAATAVLEASGPLPVEELKERVAKRLRLEHSLSGFSLRFKEVLRNAAFVVESSGVRLAKDNRDKERRVAK